MALLIGADSACSTNSRFKRSRAMFTVQNCPALLYTSPNSGINGLDATGVEGALMWISPDWIRSSCSDVRSCSK
jgi:hypothetical protein